MTRAERNEFNYIRRRLKSWSNLGYGSTLTIRTDAGSQYKHELDAFYLSLGFHPAGITTDSHRFDGKERIVYIFGQTWQDDEGNERSWEELYSREEKERYAAALD